MKQTLSMLICVGTMALTAETTTIPMVIIVPSYNNEKWLEANITSILTQNYTNYRTIYIDDCSKDRTVEGVKTVLTTRNIHFQTVEFDDEDLNHEEATRKFSNLINDIDPSTPFILVHNLKHYGAMANFYRVIHSMKDHEVVVTLDGDDWFAHNNVLAELNHVYTTQNVWITHGKLIEYPNNSTAWCIPVPEDYVQRNAFREYRCPSHCRTFYAWLFKQIRLEDLLFEDKFFAMTCDQATMFPMMEMAGERHAFISEVNYVYNVASNLNDNKVDPDLQNQMEHFIRNKPRYQRLERAMI